MNAEQLERAIKTGVRANHSILIKGKPGAGKTDIVKQSAATLGVDLVMFHPSVSDPTDIKGFPWCHEVDGQVEADFIPYGEMKRLLTPQKRTIAFFDDLGHASESVQKSLMQVLWAKQLNEFKISDNVVFLGATNDLTHKAGVMGLIEPLKSRWHSIIEYESTPKDWKKWAYTHNMPSILISFADWRPALWDAFKPTKEIKNSPCPRTIANFGLMLNAGYDPDIILDMGIGAVGEGFMTEFIAFEKTHQHLPNIDDLIANPKKAEVPADDPALMYALIGAIAVKTTKDNIDNIVLYMDRLPQDFAIILARDARTVCKAIDKKGCFTQWLLKHQDLIL